MVLQDELHEFCALGLCVMYLCFRCSHCYFYIFFAPPPSLILFPPPPPVRITPVDQIHGLAPHLQPRAWLEVLASANTTPDEKSEAMEEVLIVAKDKRHARILLEEGILDSLLFILNRYFDKKQRNENNNIATATKIEIREVTRAKLAANCCLTLGKAHCAAVHTEGDLLLMSMYERGTVPEERQLAQMLYEVPHHVLSQEPDVFVIQQTTMSAAETLANSIKDLATAARTR